MFACILRRVFGFKRKNLIFCLEDAIFKPKIAIFEKMFRNMLLGAKKNAFWCLQSEKTHRNYPQTKGFAFKHRQNHFKHTCRNELLLLALKS